MSKNFVPPARPIEQIHPALDFTEDTAFVGVGLPPATGNIFNSQAIVMTSGGRVIPWNDDSFLENGLVPVTNSMLFNGLFNGQVFLEPRWSLESIETIKAAWSLPLQPKFFKMSALICKNISVCGIPSNMIW